MGKSTVYPLSIVIRHCSCDSPNRDESAQYMAEKGTAGDLPQKTPVVCTEQPRSESDESDGRVIITPGGILPLQRTVGGGDAPKFATPSKDPQQVRVHFCANPLLHINVIFERVFIYSALEDF